MGVYIKGVEMPKCCAECPLNHDAECYPHNSFVCDDPYTQRSDWCPLVEVPPHGRLIDADKYREEIHIRYEAAKEWCVDSINDDIKHRADAARITYIECLLTLKNAPTVIEEEDG